MDLKGTRTIKELKENMKNSKELTETKLASAREDGEK